MHPFVSDLYKKLQQRSDSSRKSWMEDYLKNQFTCIGTETVSRRRILKELIKQKLPPFSDLPLILGQMWQMEREMQLCAIELAAAYKKEWQPDFIALINTYLLKDSWWDSVDHMVAEWINPYFKKFPAQIIPVTQAWNHSDNTWLQRCSITFQRGLHQATDTRLLSAYILHCAASKEFFVQKAIGWALREYGKKSPDWVLSFVQQHQQQLSPLSKREALKNIPH